jgi:PAS domain S-box-containing protein
MQRAFQAAAPEFAPAEYENTFTNLRGERRVIAWRSAPVRDESGEIVSLLAGGIDITDRKLQEIDLRASEERLRAVIQSSPVAIVEVDLENRVLTWNPGAQRIFGWTAEEVTGRRVPIMGPEHEAESGALDRRIRSGEVIAGLETTRRRKDGTNVDVEVAAAPVRGSDGSSVGLIALYLDVTERKRREIELQRERDATETLVQTIPTLIVVVDENAHILLDDGRAGINRAFKDRLGWSDDDVGDRSLLEFIHPDDAYAAVMGIASAANGVPAVERKSRWRRANGESVVVEWTATPMPDPSMAARPLVLISATDVTERAEHEEEIRRQRDFLSTIARSTPSLMAVVDSDAVVSAEGVNRAFEENIGYGDEEVEGRPLHELIDAAADAETFIRATTAAGTGVEHETTWTSRYGEELRIAWSTQQLDLGYEQPRFLVHGTDMTERNRQAEEIRASRTRIVQAADDARRKLERNLHDGAQQRLVALSVSLRLAEAKLASDPESAAGILAAARDELAHALEELRELARGIHPAVLTDRGLPAAIEGLVARTPLPVETELPDDALPPAVEAALYYVVSESLANVVKYAGATAVSVRIARSGDGTVTAEVSDDGVGGADPSHGSGLSGLADRVEALDGRLWVESPTGGGTRIRVEVPIPAPAATTTVSEASTQ